MSKEFINSLNFQSGCQGGILTYLLEIWLVLLEGWGFYEEIQGHAGENRLVRQ